MKAVIQGKTNIFRYLLEHYGEFVHQQAPTEEVFCIAGCSMCALACIDAGDLEMIQLVVDAGYDVNIPNRPRGVGRVFALAMRALDNAKFTVTAERRDPSMFEEGWANVKGVTPLGLLSANGHMVGVQVLLRAKADLSLVNCHGRSPLVLAAMRGHSAVAKVLLEAGASPNVTDTGGRTAAGWARERGHADLATMIESHR